MPLEVLPTIFASAGEQLDYELGSLHEGSAARSAVGVVQVRAVILLARYRLCQLGLRVAAVAASAHRVVRGTQGLGLERNYDRAGRRWVRVVLGWAASCGVEYPGQPRVGAVFPAWVAVQRAR